MLSYAAGALDPAEREALRAHLASGCPRCAVELAEAEATVAQLPLALDPVTPSAGARAKLMERVKGSATPSTMRITPAATPQRSRWLSYAAAACMGALLAAVTVQYVYHGIYQNRVARLDAKIASMQGELNNRDATIQQIATLIDSPDLRLVALQPTDQQPQARARILWDRARQRWQINVFDVKPPKLGQAYELWFFGQDKKPVAGPMLHVDASGQGKMLVDVPQNIGPITLAAFTNEPEKGVQEPTGDIHFKSELAP